MEESINKRRKLDDSEQSSIENDINIDADDQNAPIAPEQIENNDKEVDLDNNPEAFSLTENGNKDPVDLIMEDNGHIPKDSILFEDVDESLTSFELPPDLLIKANLATLKLNLQSSEALPIRTQFLINSVPLLDNVSTQILRLIGVGPYEETLAIITSDEPTAQSLVYKDLVELFEQVKRIYSEDDPFLKFTHFFSNLESLDEESKKSLKSFENPVDLAIRKANLATFLLSTLGSIEVGFFFLNESFLDVFCPVYDNFFKSIENNHDGDTKPDIRNNARFGKLLKVQAALFLELKTQAYISALEAGDRSKEEILEDIFPPDLMEFLLKRRNSHKLSPSELDFINRTKSRKETLLNAQEYEDLSESYDWLIFLKELFSYVSKNIGILIWGKKTRSNYLTPLQTIDSVISKSHPYTTLSKEELQQKLQEQRKKEEELNEERQRQAMKSTKLTRNRKTNNNNEPSISLSTSKERLAAQGPPRIRNILRRPWSANEETALVDALKKVGPYWSKILEHYGAGGSISEALKNRTQVQLKDKARNWKMSYLKNGSEVPSYLSKVTGVIERDDRQVNARKKQRKKLEEERNRLIQGHKQQQEAQKEKENELNKENNSNNEAENEKESTPVNVISEGDIDSALLEQSKAETTTIDK